MRLFKVARKFLKKIKQLQVRRSNLTKMFLDKRRVLFSTSNRIRSTRRILGMRKKRVKGTKVARRVCAR